MLNFIFSKKKPVYSIAINYDEGMEEGCKQPVTFRAVFNESSKRWERQAKSAYAENCPTEEFTEEARRAVLGRFGLWRREREFPVKKLRKMPPQELEREGWRGPGIQKHKTKSPH